MKISVIGAGYVGLTTAACLAEIGHSVRCADNDEAKLNLLRSAQVPFFEPISRKWFPGIAGPEDCNLNRRRAR